MVCVHYLFMRYYLIQSRGLVKWELLENFGVFLYSRGNRFQSSKLLTQVIGLQMHAFSSPLVIFTSVYFKYVVLFEDSTKRKGIFVRAAFLSM